MSMSRHAHFEELISASLAGDLSESERAQLDAHLDGCAACRGTLASFAEQRRIMSGLRHVAPPRDLGARVRSGIERGAFLAVPWWRRPAVLFAGLGGGLAAVAGALLAVVILNGVPDDSNIGVGSGSPLPSFSAASASSGPESAPPSVTPAASEPAVSIPPPSPAPPEASPEPDVYLAYTGPFDNLLLTLRDGRTGATIRELSAPGPAIAAELSPNGQFLAYITRLGESGMNEVWVTHIGSDVSLSDGNAPRVDTALADWETMSLGQSMAGSEFLEHLTWSPDSSALAFTLADVDGGGPDAWQFDSGSGVTLRITTTGAAYVGSWARGEPDSRLLWVSLAGPQPRSQLIDTASGSPVAEASVFQPLVSPDGARVIYWTGVMDRSDAGEWAFVEGGAPHLAEVQSFQFVNERPLFTDVTIDRDAFVSAGIAWGADSDAFAVWNAEWTGLGQGSGGEYPSIRRVYFGHASDSRSLRSDQAIDEGDLDMDATVVDVKVPTARHLLITALEPIGGVMEAPRATLRLVTRNTGSVPDEVRVFEGPGDDAWFGPGAYDAYWEAAAP